MEDEQCTLHNEPFVMVCYTCDNKLICLECVTVHKDHQIITLKSIVKEKQGTVQDDIRMVINRMIASAKVVKSYVEGEKQIKSVFEQMHIELMKLEEQCKREFEEQRLQLRSTIKRDYNLLDRLTYLNSIMNPGQQETSGSSEKQPNHYNTMDKVDILQNQKLQKQYYKNNLYHNDDSVDQQQFKTLKLYNEREIENMLLNLNQVNMGDGNNSVLYNGSVKQTPSAVDKDIQQFKQFISKYKSVSENNNNNNNVNNNNNQNNQNQNNNNNLESIHLDKYIQRMILQVNQDLEPIKDKLFFTSLEFIPKQGYTKQFSDHVQTLFHTEIKREEYKDYDDSDPKWMYHKAQDCFNKKDHSKIPSTEKEKCFQQYLLCAESHITEAYIKLGMCYEEGFGVVKSDTKAIEWYRKGIDSGFVDEGFQQIDKIFKVGTLKPNVTNDIKTNYAWYLSYANKGSQIAKGIVSIGFSRGIGNVQFSQTVNNNNQNNNNNNNTPKKIDSKKQNNLENKELEEFNELMVKAKGGDTKSQFEMAQILQTKFVNIEKAIYWYDLAAKGGHREAMNQLGMIYEKGKDIPQDQALAFKYYQESAMKLYNSTGSISGMYNLGRCYTKGFGCNIDYMEAVKWLELSSNQNHAESYNLLGYIYESQVLSSTIKNQNELAFKCYKKSAEIGNPEAQYNLGCCYLFGVGVIIDKAKAYQLFVKAASGGHDEAEYMVGLCAENGSGVVKDDKIAFQHYMKASTLGNPQALYFVGKAYQFGKGTNFNYKMAFECYDNAAKGGSTQAMVQLGRQYLFGIGVDKNKQIAFNYFKEAADLGDKVAYTHLSACYENGIGVNRNHRVANEYKRSGIDQQSIRLFRRYKLK